jgi:hypothetical protein
MRLLPICMLAGASFVVADTDEDVRAFEPSLPLSEAYIPGPSSTAHLDSTERRGAFAASAFTWPRKEGIQARQTIASPPLGGEGSSSAISPPALKQCWNGAACKETLEGFARCQLQMDPLGINNPNNVTTASLSYQVCLCGPGYKEFVSLKLILPLRC